jgi:hypothetical protein
VLTTVGLFQLISRNQGSDFQPAIVFVDLSTEGEEFSEEGCGSAVFGSIQGVNPLA